MPRLNRWVLACAVGMLALMRMPCAIAATDFLDPDVAFRFSAHMVDAHTVLVHYDIADGYYLYRERFHFLAEPSSVTLGDAQLPKGEIKFDETFGKNVEHYRKSVEARIAVTGSGPFTLVSTAQGCADAGLCYPPQTKRLALVAGATGVPTDASSSAPSVLAGAASPDAAPVGVLGLGSAMAALKSGNLAKISLVFIGFGLLLAFTPCVLPMVPILSSIIVGEADHPLAGEGRRHRPHIDRMRGFALALVYSLGMALVYTSLGVAAGLAGQGLVGLLQKPPVLWAFAVLLVILSLSMFGFYELQVPSGFQSRVSRMSSRAAGGRFAGVFIMGALSALIVGPCVAAPLAATLLFIGETHDVFVGGVALFSLAAGMSVPLLIVGISAGELLPRAGAWMESVKRFFGVLLIAVALWMIAPVVSTALQMLLWAALLIVSAVFMRAFEPLLPTVTGWPRLWKGIGLMLAFLGAAELLGVATGGRDVMAPLSQFARAHAAAAPLAAQPVFARVHSVAELDARLHEAKQPIMLDFYADWCVSCKEMERFVYTDARVGQQLSHFTLLQVDVTDSSPDDAALLKRFKLFGPPATLFFDARGNPLPAATLVGYADADAFLQILAQASS